MKNLARIIIALFATQLLVAGIAHAAASTAIDHQTSVCAMPGEEEPTEGF